MNMNIYWIVVVVVVLLLLTGVFQQGVDYVTEGFNNQAGQFCTTCAGKTFNQCSGCFNCGYCVDRYGNGGCIGGDHKGPYNFERCARWYSGDPYAYMLQRNKNYQCNYGPRSSNRLIGV